MSAKLRSILLRVDGFFLVVAGIGAWFKMDFPASFASSGPLGPLIAHEPALGIAFVEAHGLAAILGVLLWRAASTPSWHVTGAAVHALLGISNVVFWNLFVVTGTLPMGYVTTTLHGVLVALQLWAAFSASHGQDAPRLKVS